MVVAFIDACCTNGKRFLSQKIDFYLSAGKDGRC